MQKPCILIIDDDDSLRKTLAAILRIKGYETVLAGTGAEGIARLAELAVNVALIDLGLPDIAGIELLNRIKTDYPRTEAIILTGNATLDSAIEATNRGAYSYLLKPYDIEKLIFNLEKIVEQQQVQQQIARYRAEVERTNLELQALNEISSAVSGSLDLETLLPELLRALINMKIFPFEMKGALFLAEDGVLRRGAFLKLSAEEVEPCEYVRPDECLCGLALTTGQIVTSGSSEDPRHTTHAPHVPPHGHVIIPLKAAAEVVGVLCIYTLPGLRMDFDQPFLDLLTAIGNKIGTAIANARLFEETKASSLHDALTGLANRRFLELQLVKVFDAAKRYGKPLSLVMIDIDHFKQFNDTHGHAEGDVLLKKLGGVLMGNMRNADYAFRYGGEEFLVLLPGTDSSGACMVAERLRKMVQEVTGNTVSLGVASYVEVMESKEDLVKLADAALYRAKAGGRNRVETAG